MELLILKAGAIIHYGGLPVELAFNTPVYGNKKNFIPAEDLKREKERKRSEGER